MPIQRRPRQSTVHSSNIKNSGSDTADRSSGSPGVLRGLLAGIRPADWVKNTFVFAALLFSGKALDTDALIRSLVAFAALCLASSATYLLNDVRDRAADKLHPTKRNRPIAAGIVSPALAIGVGIVAAAVAVLLAFSLNWQSGATLLGYLALTTTYTVLLKNIVVLDVMALAIGFVLRVILGAEAIQVEFSSWLVLCTFMLALFLGFGKRRHELTLLKDQAHGHRAILSEYSPHFLDMMIGIVTASTVMSYVLYTMDAHTIERFGSRNLIYSSVLVLYGIFRYLYLVHLQSSGGSPVRIVYRDRPIQVAVLFWIVTIFLLRYL